MKRILYLSTLSILIFSCSSSKRFDYGQAYKFSRYTSVKQQPIEPNNPPILVASKTSTLGYIPLIPEKLPIVRTQSTQKLSKKEKHNLIKEIKQIGKDLKRLRKEDPAKADIKAQQATKALTGKVYAGTIIGIAGIILLILDIASPLGVLAFVAGLALVVWGLIEQGSF